jgi:hypothetical protein
MHHRLAIVTVLILSLGYSALADAPEGNRPVGCDLYGDSLPPGALVRIGTMQLRHEAASAAISPDGNVLATKNDNSLRLWSMATGKLLLQIKDRFDWWPAMFSPDGRWLAVTRNGSLDLLDATTGKPVRQIPKTDRILAFSPDSKLVATVPKEPTPPLRGQCACGIRRLVSKLSRCGDRSRVSGTPASRRTAVRS